MIAEQLQAARAAHWRQQHNPILTLEDAQSWIEQHPLCLFLPRKAQLPAPAPSFVEAVLGESNPTPPPPAIEQARELLIRLIDSGHAVALNLLGGLGEQPDFVAQTGILPFAVSFRGERDWRQPPGKAGSPKVSPLVLDLWKVLEKEGPLTAPAIREKLGRELTEAAVMRALSELWQTIRVLPALQAQGRPALWALTQHHHREALTKSSSTSQVTAISLLVSMYLQSVYAATNEEIEIFLSPLVSRSRIREAVRGLAATRQIQSLSMDAQTYYFLEGGLPEFAAEPQPARAEPAPRRRPDMPRPAARPERTRDWKRKPAAPGATPSQPAAKWRKLPQPGENTPGQNRPPQRREGASPRRPDMSRPAARPERTRDWKRKPAAPGATPSQPAAKWRKLPQPGENTPGQVRPPQRREGASPRRPDMSRPAARPERTRDWKRKPAAPGATPSQPAAKWRKLPQPGENTPGQVRPPQRREGASPWKKPRWDRNRPPAAPFKPQPKDARAQGGAPRRDPASRPPYRTKDRDNRGNKPGQGFSLPKRRSSAPDKPAPGEGRPASRRPGNFKPRNFDSRTGSGRPKSAKFPGKPKSSFRDRNLGKKKPEA